MHSKLKKILLFACTLAFLFAFAGFAAAFAAEQPDGVDKNGWLTETDGVAESSLSEGDEYSAIQLDHSGKTYNTVKIDLSETQDFFLALRIGESTSDQLSLLSLVAADDIAGWESIGDTSVLPMRIALQNTEVTPAQGFGTEEVQPWQSDADETHYFMFHIGTGGEDTSYVIFDGERCDSTVTVSDFTDGDGYGLYVHLCTQYARSFELSSFTAPIVTSAAPTSFDISGGSSQSMTINYINAAQDANFVLSAPQFGTDEMYTFDAEEDYSIDTQSGTITVNASLFPKVSWLTDGAYILIETEGGAYKVPVTVVSGSAPELADGQASEFIFTQGAFTEDLSIGFEYSGTPILSVGQAPYSYSATQARANVDESYYTVSESGGIRELTIDAEYLNDLESGVYWFTLLTPNGNAEVSVLIRPAEEGWIVRDGKGTIGESSLGENYVQLDFGGWVGDISEDSRALYSVSFDVTKPFFIEYGNYTEGGWIMLNLDSNPYAAEYTNEGTSTPGYLKLLDMVPNTDTNEPARFGSSIGFVTTGTVGFGTYMNEYNTNVLEIYVGETTEESYIKYNGYDITAGFNSVTLERSQFPEGIGWLSLYIASETTVDFNKNVNAVAVNFIGEEPSYALKSDNTVSVQVLNYSEENDIVVRQGGETLVAGTDYTFENGTLTILSSYLRGIAYTSMINFEVESGGTATNFNVRAYIGDSDGSIAVNGENYAFFNGSDVSFTLDMGEDEFINVISSESEEPLDASAYSYETGTVTFYASALGSFDRGVTELLIQTTYNLVPVYIVSYDFENGYDAEGEGQVSGTFAEGITVSGGADIVREGLADLTEGIAFDLTFTSVSGYYSTGNGDQNAHIAFEFYDIQSGNTLVARIRPNGDDNDDSIRYKLWIELCVYDADGNTLERNTSSMPMNVFEEHKVQIYVENGSAYLLLDDDIPISVGLNGCASDELILSVETLQNTTGDDQMGYTLCDTEFTAGNDPSDDGEDPTEDPDDVGAGCRGAVGGCSAAALFVCAAASAVLVLRARRKNG